ncbi:MAG: ABC transporter permease [Planctomycetota bacterium]
MSQLIPFDFASLGFAEFVWLILAGTGLSLAVTATGWRGKFARNAGLICLGVGLLRQLSLHFDGVELSAWSAWVGPVVVTPLLVAFCVLFGCLQDRLSPRVRSLWLVALLVWTAVARPFDAAIPEWTYVAFLGAALVALVQTDGSWRAFIVRPVAGPIPSWGFLALAFVLLCVLVHPFGMGAGGAALHLFLVWLLYAMFEQGQEMQKFVMRRLTGAPIVILIILVLSFVMMRTAPGGPYTKEKAVDPALQKFREEEAGYNKPWPTQFGLYIVQIAWSGDLGKSEKQQGRKVNEIIRDHVVPSAQLGLVAIVVALLIGTLAGIISGIRSNSIFDYASMSAAMIGLALPTFVVGPFLVLLFAMKLGWFRVAGWDVFPKDLILPAITLALPFAARIARLTRAGMLEIVNQDYVRTARAKGLDERTIVVRHTLKGALLPVVSYIGPAFAQLLTGSLVVEKIFGIPGLGTEFVNGALNRDYAVSMGLVLFFGSLLVLSNLIVDVAYGYLDPRIRHA